MSVINQVLLELEKRRASGAERGALPDHVRALPDSSSDQNGWWIALGGAAAVVLAAMAWLAVSGFGFPRSAASVAPALPGTDAVIEKVVLASAATMPDLPGQDGEERSRPAGRLSLELSSPPATPPLDSAQSRPRAAEAPSPAPRAQAAIPAARVLDRPAPENAGASTDAPAPGAGPPPEAGKGTPKTRPTAVATAADKPAAVSAAKGAIEKHERQPTTSDLADHEYRKAAGLLQQGRFADALEGFRVALKLNATHHAARQSLVALLVESKAIPEAERTLQDGLKLAPDQSGFAMTLARLQVNRGDNAGAIATLQGGVAYAQGNPEYAAFFAALLQRQGRHEDAIEQFKAALRVKPNTGVWWLGMAMSLQATNRASDAQEAYRRAKTTPNLSPELSAFADQRLRQLQ